MPKPTFYNLPDDKRERIIEAALTEFAEQPYARANLDRIVRAAGISKGSMYQYFGGKSDLYRWLITEYMASRKMAAIGAAAPAADASIWSVLESAFLAGVRFAAAEPRLSNLGVRFMRDSELEPELAAVAHHLKAAGDAWVLELLERGVAAGELRDDLDLGLASSFLAHAMGEGMLAQLAGLLGLSQSDFLAQPEASGRLSDDQLLGLVRRITRLFREGAGS